MAQLRRNVLLLVQKTRLSVGIANFLGRYESFETLAETRHGAMTFSEW